MHFVRYQPDKAAIQSPAHLWQGLQFFYSRLIKRPSIAFETAEAILALNADALLSVIAARKISCMDLADLVVMRGNRGNIGIRLQLNDVLSRN